MNNKVFASLAGLIFIILVFVVMIVNILIPDKSFSSEENRILQDIPVLSVANYFDGRFEEKLDNYANDQFMLRNGFIKVKTSADITTGQVKSNGVYNCKDDYLMEEINVPNKDTMDKTISALNSFRRKYATTKMYFLLAPNAANILGDKLPAFVKVADQNRYMDAFFDQTSEIGYTSIDVRDALNESKSSSQIYYRTDHHWTTDGAYVAFNTACPIMGIKDSIKYREYTVKNNFRGTLASKSGFTNGTDDPIKIYMPEDKNYKNSVIYYHDTKEKTTEFYKLDNLKEKDSYTVFGGSNHPIYTITTPTESKKKLLLIKDSYANSFIPFISQYYREVVVVDPRYFFDSIDEIIKSEGITDVLFLYNANTFFEDDALEMMLSN